LIETILKNNVLAIINKFVKSDSFYFADSNVILLLKISEHLNQTQWKNILEAFLENDRLYGLYISIMQTILLSSEEVAQQAMKLYEAGIRETVEIDNNIGQMAIIDIETGAYYVDANGIESARYLRQQNPNARLFGIQIGYNVAVSFGGVMERTTK
jgi:hypothetical protein